MSDDLNELLGMGIGQRLEQIMFSTLNIAVLAPMPRANVTMAIAANPGARRSVRAA